MASTAAGSLPISLQGVLQIEKEGLERPLAEQNGALEETFLDKVREVAMYVLTGVGALLVIVSLSLLARCSIFGFCPDDLNSVQILFTCGLSAFLTGFTLRNREYKTELKLSDSRLPVTFTFAQK